MPIIRKFNFVINFCLWGVLYGSTMRYFGITLTAARTNAFAILNVDLKKNVVPIGYIIRFRIFANLFAYRYTYNLQFSYFQYFCSIVTLCLIYIFNRALIPTHFHPSEWNIIFLNYIFKGRILFSLKYSHIEMNSTVELSKERSLKKLYFNIIFKLFLGVASVWFLSRYHFTNTYSKNTCE